MLTENNKEPFTNQLMPHGPFFNLDPQCPSRIRSSIINLQVRYINFQAEISQSQS